MIRYTEQQYDVIDHMLNNDGILLIEAGAGTGKSFIARRVVHELGVKSGIYTAFNKAIVLEGENKFFGTPVECKTFHALAYKYVLPKMEIKPLSYKCIKEKLTYNEKRDLIDALESFFVSKSTCMYEYFNDFFRKSNKKKYMVELCAEYVEGMLNDKINPTFNFLLKYLHLMLVEKTVVIDTDILILDEINDVTAVSLEIFKLINAPKKLGLGETNQAIYEFLNLVNGFEELKDVSTTLRFTQSYRCSVDVAKRIEDKMKDVLSDDFEFVGTDKPVKNGKTLYCTLTNASIVDSIQRRLAKNKSFTLLRKPSDIFAAPLAVLTSSMGRRPYQSKFAFLVDVYDEFRGQKEHKSYYSYLTSVLDDDEITGAVKLLRRLSSEGLDLFKIYKEAKEIEPDESYTISTVFTSKGLEFETVYISDDLNSKFTSACTGKLSDNDALIIKKCYYVAASRCGVNLYNSVL